MSGLKNPSVFSLREGWLHMSDVILIDQLTAVECRTDELQPTVISKTPGAVTPAAGTSRTEHDKRVARRDERYRTMDPKATLPIRP